MIATFAVQISSREFGVTPLTVLAGSPREAATKAMAAFTSMHAGTVKVTSAVPGKPVVVLEDDDRFSDLVEAWASDSPDYTL